MPITNADLPADDLLARWIVENSPIKVPFFQAWFWQTLAGTKMTLTARLTNMSRPIAPCTILRTPRVVPA